MKVKHNLDPGTEVSEDTVGVSQVTELGRKKPVLTLC